MHEKHCCVYPHFSLTLQFNTECTKHTAVYAHFVARFSTAALLNGWGTTPGGDAWELRPGKQRGQMRKEAKEAAAEEEGILHEG